jgi:hypothetical protein
MELVTPSSQKKEPTGLKIRVLKGKKYVFRDALRIKKYFQENFALSTN